MAEWNWSLIEHCAIWLYAILFLCAVGSIGDYLEALVKLQGKANELYYDVHHKDRQ